MRIGNHEIGYSGAPFIIAEIGVNHDGSVARARQLVEAAASAGADAVKFQYFSARSLLCRAAPLADYQREAGAADSFSMLAQLELSIGDLATLVEFAETCHVHPIVTVFSLQHVPEVRQIAFAAYKIASPDIIHRPLIEAVCQLGKPVIMSTGAATADEVQEATAWVRRQNCEFALMQCISAYPTPAISAHLAGITTLHTMVGAPVGYSDHTVDELTGGLAVAAGATLLEKHITYDQSVNGPDHAMSLDPVQFKRYVTFARQAAQMLGEPQKIVHQIEMNVRKVSRQSIVAARKLRAGQKIQAEDLAIKRPGIGLAPARLHDLIGCTLAMDAEPDSALSEAHFKPRMNMKRKAASQHTAEVY